MTLRLILFVACVLLSLFHGQAFAEDRLPPPSVQSMKMSFAPIVRAVAPAVVNVYASRLVNVPTSPLMQDPFFRRFFGDQLGGMRQRQQNSLGSGVIVATDGVIVTNNHVVENATDVKIALTDRREFDADVLLKDKELDLAVLKIRDLKEKLPTVTIGNSDALEVGDLVLAIGNPFGVGQTVTNGIVSALARSQVGVSDYQFFIQTDAAINPGNSGGALIDMNSHLVGINSAIYSSSGGSNGIGFAIPSNMVKIALQSAMKGKRIELPWVGADLQPVTAEVAEAIGLDRPVGLLVQSVVRSGPASSAGILDGDIITKLDGQDVFDARVFNYKLAEKGVGATVGLDVIRRGQQFHMTMPIVAPQETVPRDEVVIGGQNPFQGLTVVNISPKTAAELGLAYHGEKGVVVAKVDEDGLAAQAGFQPSDIVVDVNGSPIRSTADLRAVAKTEPKVWRITVNRGGQTLRMAFRG